jgi:GT2 family glycosyltransferase
VSHPKVSVFIPAWNREGLVGDAIASTLRQTFRDFECIVLDAGSTDGTADLVASPPRLGTTSLSSRITTSWLARWAPRFFSWK